MIATKRKSKRRPKPASVDEMIADYAAAGAAQKIETLPDSPYERVPNAKILPLRWKDQRGRWLYIGEISDGTFTALVVPKTMPDLNREAAFGPWDFVPTASFAPAQFELNRRGHVHHWQCSEPEEPGDDQVSIPPARRGPGMFGRGAASATAAERAELRRRNETETVQLGPSAFAAPARSKHGPAWSAIAPRQIRRSVMTASIRRRRKDR